ncbi:MULTISPECIES: hypothetical protein [Hymenobacter]|uniref:Uncharacterized protein n=2 Tax=Hymenobacter TaxID=89966 RepID=A0A4Z0MCY5_9BACT|nr:MULTISPECIES: hypothetical protein [Hymenobacter]TGD77356.1 hypothetical protein EU557_23630 [Hymenobacter wooponensis]TGE03574.1 hypothetical protein EU556_25625 [Hymenobacter fodinae]
MATAHLVTPRVVQPGATMLARLTVLVRECTSRTVYRQLAARLLTLQCAALEDVLILLPGERFTPMQVLRTPPTRVSAPALAGAFWRLEQLRAVGVGDILVRDLPEDRVTRMVRHAQVSWAQRVSRMLEDRRLATLLVFMHALERTATDDILDLLDGLVSTLALRAENKLRSELLRCLGGLDKAAFMLHH